VYVVGFDKEYLGGGVGISENVPRLDCCVSMVAGERGGEKVLWGRVPRENVNNEFPWWGVPKITVDGPRLGGANREVTRWGVVNITEYGPRWGDANGEVPRWGVAKITGNGPRWGDTNGEDPRWGGSNGEVPRWGVG